MRASIVVWSIEQFHLCSNHIKKPVKLSIEFIKDKSLKEICPETKSTLRIAYNNFLPNFNIVDSKPDYASLEGDIIEKFLEK